jgi:hypothetical protein
VAGHDRVHDSARSQVGQSECPALLVAAVEAADEIEEALIVRGLELLAVTLHEAVVRLVADDCVERSDPRDGDEL